MTTPTSGEIALTHLQTEFGGSNPISMSEYYAGGGYTPAGASGSNGAIPSSGTISLWNFYGATASYGTPIALFAGGDEGYGTGTSDTYRFTFSGAAYGTKTNVGIGGGAGLSLNGKGISHTGFQSNSYSYNNITREYSSAGAVVGSDTNIGTARSNNQGASVSIGITHGGQLEDYSFVAKTNRITDTRAVYGSETSLGHNSYCSGGGFLSRDETLFFGNSSGTLYKKRINTSGALIVSESVVTGVYTGSGDVVDDVLLVEGCEGGTCDTTAYFKRYNYLGTQQGSTTTTTVTQDFGQYMSASPSVQDGKVFFFSTGFTDNQQHVIVNSAGTTVFNNYVTGGTQQLSATGVVTYA